MVSIGRTWITHSLWTTEPAQRQRPGPRATPSVGALVRGRRPRRGEADAASGKQERNALSVYARSTEPRRTLSQDAPVGLRVVRFAPRRLSSTPRSLWRSLARPRDRGAGHDGRARRQARASPQAFAGGRLRVPVNSSADRRSSHSPAGDALTQLPRGRSTIGLGMCSQCPASPDLALPARVAPLRPNPPPPPPDRCSCGFASFTVKRRPSNSCWSSAVQAARPALASAISTNPKPRDCPVARSRMRRTESTWPYGVNSACELLICRIERQVTDVDFHCTILEEGWSGGLAILERATTKTQAEQTRRANGTLVL